MAEGYHANNKKTPQGVTNVEVILFNHQKKGVERINRAMERANRAMEKSKQSNGKDFISS
jgi:hypothetical protein